MKKRTLTVHEHCVFFLSTDEELKLKRTILVPDVPKHDAEGLECFLESPKKGGGKVEFEKYDEATENLWITFASQSGASLLVFVVGFSDLPSSTFLRSGSVCGM